MEMGAADQGPSGIGSAAAEGHKSSQQQDCKVLHDQKIAGCLTPKLQWPYRIAILGFPKLLVCVRAPRIAGSTEIAKLRSVESEWTDCRRTGSCFPKGHIGKSGDTFT